MAEIIDDEFLVSNYRAVEYSKYILESSSELENYLDIADQIKSYMTTLTIDRRAIAISTDYHCHLWDFFSSRVTGFKESVYVGLNHFSQLISNVLRPSTALVSFPDHNSTLVKSLNSIGCSLYFLNSQSLFNFENFVVNHESFDQDISYGTISYQDLLAEQNVLSDLDLIVSGSIDFTSEPTLLEKYISMLRSGGVLYIGETSDFGNVSKDVRQNRMSQLHDAIKLNNNIYNYYIPFGIGFDIIIKK